MNNFIPTTLAEKTIEGYLPRVSLKSQLIYTTVVFAVITIFVCLPFIYVNVSTTAPGIIQAEIEKQDVIAPTSGYIQALSIRENGYVAKNTTLFTIDPTGIKNQNALNHSKRSELQAYLDDIETLLNNSNNLKTANYRTAYFQYQEALQEAQSRLNKMKIDFERSKQLFKEKVMAATEYENAKLNYDQALSAYNLVTQKQRSVWQSEQLQYREQLRSVQSSELQLAEDLKKYVVTAPVSGNVQQLQGVQVGSYVIAGQKIAEISPDTGILVQCYINPSRVGLINKEQPVFVQVAAFNYNEWGILNGKVIEVANDVSLIGPQQQPAFKVRCRVDKNFLQLKNGYKGYLQKGMTVTARFVIARRSLFQLLYDKIDNWLNPALAAE